MKEFNLSDLEGIGPVTIKKLEKVGIKTPLDIVIRGVKEFSRISGLSMDVAQKHTLACIDFLADSELNLKVDNMDELEKLEASQIRIPIKVDEIDEMTGGGFETQSLYEIYGEEGSGKTQMSMTVAIECLGNGYGIEIIDCEGAIKSARLKQIAEARGIEFDKEKIGFHRYMDSELLSSGLQNIAGELLDKNVKVVIIDGLVGLMRLGYQGRGELNERQIELETVMKYLRNMAVLFNICIIITNQVTANPDPFGAKIKPIGGHILGHYVKYIYQISKGMKNNRTVRLIKSPDRPQGDYACFVNEEGISQHESLTKKIKEDRMKEVVREDTQGLIKKDLLLDVEAEQMINEAGTDKITMPDSPSKIRVF